MVEENLIAEFERIKRNHRNALKSREARIVLGPSILRVFEKGTKQTLQPVMEKFDVDSLPTLQSEAAYRIWFEKHLDDLAEAILVKNRENLRINPGYQWGHGTKILSIYMRHLVLGSRYFTEAKAEHITPWLYCPIDGVVIDRLRDLGYKLPFERIKDINTPKEFYDVQDMLGQAAEKAGVPRVWFDDVWSEQ